MKPLVSILIPAYNAQEWIADTIESAIGQTWPVREIIVVDDGSTDQTASVVQRFTSRNVSFVSQPNAGAAATRNHLLSLSNGDYIQWLDADDLLSSDKIAKQIEVLERTGDGARTLLSSAWGYFHYRASKADFRPTQLWCDLTSTEWLLRKMEFNLHMQTATWLVSRTLAEEAGPWNTTLLGDDDGEYFARVIMKSDRIRFVPEAKVFYRRSGYSRLSYIGESAKKMEAQFTSMQLNIQYVRSLDDGLRARVACVTYLQNWLPNFYPERLDIVEQAEQLAESLGGRLEQPRFSWKYAWIAAFFGVRPARAAQILLPRLRASLVRAWDKALFRLEEGHPAIDA